MVYFLLNRYKGFHATISLKRTTSFPKKTNIKTGSLPTKLTNNLKSTLTSGSPKALLSNKNLFLSMNRRFPVERLEKRLQLLQHRWTITDQRPATRPQNSIHFRDHRDNGASERRRNGLLEETRTNLSVTRYEHTTYRGERLSKRLLE